MKRQDSIPVIDLFAGPGGLGEGFSSLVSEAGERRFDVRVSIEKDPTAHQTLSLRALYRAFPAGKVPDCYYDYVRGEITRKQLFEHSMSVDAARTAASEARLAELGKTPHKTIDAWIREALQGKSEWALIGGPPCQAYSLAGRARMSKKSRRTFEKDKRHFLYTEYLRIIKKFKPSVFVMENVKGMLTSQHGGSSIFDRILSDLKSPTKKLRYSVRSFVVEGEDLKPQDFVIKAEEYGVPQCRHRVILFGIRADVAGAAPSLVAEPSRFKLKPATETVSVEASLAGLPQVRSKLSKEPDSHKTWIAALKQSTDGLKLWRHEIRIDLEGLMKKAWEKAEAHYSSGGDFIEMKVDYGKKMPTSLAKWYGDERLNGVLQHQARGHMRSDLHRYMFASCFAAARNYSPTLLGFPPKLLPNHANMKAKDVPFVDRFRVQLGGRPSTTVVSHIAKDGHYYIHPDPSQCRSLTVREAARLQTFPDNYFFEGNRTSQYSQIGNAVPPLLAQQIAEVVSDFMKAAGR